MRKKFPLAMLKMGGGPRGKKLLKRSEILFDINSTFARMEGLILIAIVNRKTGSATL
jgi:hypothetical protein